MVNLGPSLTYQDPITNPDVGPNSDYGSWLWIRINNQDNLVHDGLKIEQDLPYSYEDNF